MKRIRIVNESLMGHNCRVFDAETGGDLTQELELVAIDLHIEIGHRTTAILHSRRAAEVDLIAEVDDV